MYLTGLDVFPLSNFACLENFSNFPQEGRTPTAIPTAVHIANQGKVECIIQFHLVYIPNSSKMWKIRYYLGLCAMGKKLLSNLTAFLKLRNCADEMY